MTLHLGVDIGVQGAIAIVDQSGALVETHDMPVLQDVAGRRAVNAPLLASIIFKSHATAAFVESVNAPVASCAAVWAALVNAPAAHRGKALTA
jgi:hypothetical protein